jgi:alpha-D-ribose 1-methylphosphonate 5-triphosphate synthase subunit PhnH
LLELRIGFQIAISSAQTRMRVHLNNVRSPGVQTKVALRQTGI